MKNTSLVVASIMGGLISCNGNSVLAQDKEPHIIEVPNTCSMELNQKVQGEVVDIIGCIGLIPNSVIKGNKSGKFTGTSNGELTQQMGKIIEEAIGYNIKKGEKIPLGDFTLNKNDNGFFVEVTGEFTTLSPSGADCVKVKEDNGHQTTMCNGEFTPDEIGYTENDICFSTSEQTNYKLYFGDQIINISNTVRGTLCTDNPSYKKENI